MRAAPRRLFNARREEVFPVRLAGEAARRALNASGRVLASFRRSFYVEAASGALACLGPPSLGAGPLNALCDLPGEMDWEERGLAPGELVRREGEVLRVGARFAFSLAEARAWRPPEPPRGWRREDLAGGLASLAAEAGARAPAEGLGRLIPALLGGGEPAGADPLLRAALAGARDLAGWLREALGGGGSSPPAGAAALIGLGPGLTPSGDDFVGGAMVALAALGRPAVGARLAAWALPLARERTGAVSLAHLACAAGGEGAAALHEILSALLRPGAAGLPACLEALDRIGHTSGWDALAGAASACAALAPGRRFG